MNAERYIIKNNRELECRELIDTQTGAVITFADYDDAAGQHRMTVQAMQLNTQHEATQPAIRKAA